MRRPKIPAGTYIKTDRGYLAHIITGTCPDGYVKYSKYALFKTEDEAIEATENNNEPAFDNVSWKGY